MPIFATSTINRFAQEAEDIFARDFPCIIDRVALDIVSGTHTYSLSDYVIDIRRVTWLGIKLTALSHRFIRDLSASLTSTGKPTDYIYNNIGQSQIRFFPIPNSSISTITTDLYGSEIKNRVIIEYYRTPDYVTFTIPTFVRRRLLKAYVMKQCYSIEGKGKNLKLAKYWTAKWEFLKEDYERLLTELINEPRQLIIGQDFNQYTNNLRTPHLNRSEFGIGVNEGE